MPNTSIASRLARAFAQGSLLYRQTGSITPVAIFFSRIASRKLPLAWQHARAQRHRGAIAAKVLETRRDDPRPQLAIKVSGGVGDYLIIARFLRDLYTFAEDFIFDIFASVPRNAEFVFSDLPGFRACHVDSLFDRLRKRYDAALDVCQFVVLSDGDFRPRGMRKWPRLLKAIGAINNYRSQIDVFVQNHPWLDFALARKAVYSGVGRRDFLHHIAGIPYGGDHLPIKQPEDGSEIVARLGLTSGKYITVHNGFDPGFIVLDSRATKCYRRFADIVRGIKTGSPETTIVHIGTTTSEPIAGADLKLIGDTTLAEAGELIRYARLHLDNEGGLVHLAACVGTRACVIFGPTPVDYFGYPQNLNMAPKDCGGCWWINQTWMSLCPRGDAVPRCMTAHDPDAIAATIVAALETVT